MRFLRESAIDHGMGAGDRFRRRGGEVSRIEGFSDAVFAFATTLLVVSLEVPRSFAELADTMLDFPAFGVCFALLLLIWHAHYTYFRRYGLEDNATIVLNGVLLFLVLFYVYPLKFLFGALVESILGLGDGLAGAMSRADARSLLIIYGAGFLGVFGTFAGLYARAWRLRDRLRLDALERYDTRTQLQSHLLSASIAGLSIAIAVVGGTRALAWSGSTYWLLGPVLGTHGWLRGRRRPAPETEAD